MLGYLNMHVLYLPQKTVERKTNGQDTSCKLMKFSPVHINIGNDNVFKLIQII